MSGVGLSTVYTVYHLDIVVRCCLLGNKVMNITTVNSRCFMGKEGTCLFSNRKTRCMYSHTRKSSDFSNPVNPVNVSYSLIQNNWGSRVVSDVRVWVYC